MCSIGYKNRIMKGKIMSGNVLYACILFNVYGVFVVR